MNTNISNSINLHKICKHFSCNITLRTNSINRKQHCKQAVCILSKYFSVKEIAPSTKDLANDYTKYSNIHHLKKIKLFSFGKYVHTCYTSKHTAINSKTTLPDVKSTNRIVFVVIPCKYNVVQASTNNANNDSDYANI